MRMFRRLFQKRPHGEYGEPGPRHGPFLPGGEQVGIVRNDLTRTRVTRAMNGPHTFDLVREPRNDYHSNAIMVFLDGRHIGYMNYFYADGLSPLLDRVGHSQVRCKGIISADRGDEVGQLEAAHPGVLRKWLDDGNQLSERDPGKLSERRYSSVPVKRPQPYQSELERLLGPRRAEASVAVTFEVETTPKGKYAGEPHIYVLHENSRIGELPAQYRHKDENHETVYRLILDGDLSNCSARLQRIKEDLIVVRLFPVVSHW